MRRIAAVVLACLLLTGCGEFVRVRIDVGELERRGRPNQSVMLAADGTTMATLRVANRTDIAHDELPQVLVDAIVAAEDRSFFIHDGIDFRAIGRAALANRRAGRVVEGGSTITQQLAKYRWFPEADDDFGRKVVEAHLARGLERELTKEEILVEYLNSIYFGAGAYGIAAAAQTYFRASPEDLDLPQAALLAGLVRSPESASPYTDPEAATALRGRVLTAMTETGAITPDDADIAGRSDLGVQPPPPPPDVRYPWFVEHVKRTLLADPTFGRTEAERVARLFGGGLTVRTTLEPALQDPITGAAHVLADPDGPEVAVALVDPHTGRLLASVSGRDFAVSQFDLATQSRRQPGSTFKPFALVAALSDGWRLDDTVDSGGKVFAVGDEAWRVRSQNAGALTLREATAVSSNGAYARLALSLGGSRIAEQAQAMGITSPISRNPAIVLGGLTEGVSPLELASAYGTLATGGVHVPVSVVTEVTDADGNVVWRPDVRPTVATDAATAWLTTQALVDVIDHGTGTAARLDRPAAGKTGTVQNNTDAWFAGYTPDLAAAVWIGHPEGLVPMRDVRGVHGVRAVQGGTLPARIWRDVMAIAHDARPVRDFPYPDQQAVTVRVDPVSGQLATEWCPSTTEVTGLRGEVPASYCTLHGPPSPPRAPAVPATSTAGLPTPAPSAAP
jgi:penicillin-binding protein 1A